MTQSDFSYFILFLIIVMCSYLFLGSPKTIKELIQSIYSSYSYKDGISLYGIIWFIFATVTCICVGIPMIAVYILYRLLTFKIRIRK